MAMVAVNSRSQDGQSVGPLRITVVLGVGSVEDDIVGWEWLQQLVVGTVVPFGSSMGYQAKRSADALQMRLLIVRTCRATTVETGAGRSYSGPTQWIEQSEQVLQNRW